MSYKLARHRRITESPFMKKRALGVPPPDISEEDTWELVHIIWDAPEEEVLAVVHLRLYHQEEYGKIMGLNPCED